MHELRKDPLIGRWIAVLSDSKPPDYYEVSVNPKEEAPCILCPGREKETKTEIAAVRQEAGWVVRDIPNFVPVFQVEGEMGRKGMGMYDMMNSIGANEIIVDSPEHDKSPEDLGQEHLLKVLRIYRERITDLERDSRIRQVLVLKNSGKAAGARYSHSYSEIAATPVIPKRLKDELANSRQYYAFKERCVFCDIMREEVRTGDRVIFESRDFIAFVPFAPNFPFEFWILPKKHNCSFGDVSAPEMEDLSLMLLTMLRKIRKVLREPAYNYFIHTAPNRIPRRDHWHTLGEDFHWHIEVMPRLLMESGFEIGSGLYVLTTSPEDAAKYLREA